jgi:hypothetical protein
MEAIGKICDEGNTNHHFEWNREGHIPGSFA